MKYKIIKHIDHNTNDILGYSVAIKPFPFIPWWKDFSKYHGLFETEQEAKTDMLLLLECKETLKYEDKYD